MLFLRVSIRAISQLLSWGGLTKKDALEAAKLQQTLLFHPGFLLHELPDSTLGEFESAYKVKGEVSLEMCSMIDDPSKVVDTSFKEHVAIFWSRVGFEKKPKNKHRNWVRWSHSMLRKTSHCMLLYLNLSAGLKVSCGLHDVSRPVWYV